MPASDRQGRQLLLLAHAPLGEHLAIRGAAGVVAEAVHERVLQPVHAEVRRAAFVVAVQEGAVTSDHVRSTPEAQARPVVELSADPSARHEWQAGTQD
jgi:hypothetical protein